MHESPASRRSRSRSPNRSGQQSRSPQDAFNPFDDFGDFDFTVETAEHPADHPSESSATIRTSDDQNIRRLEHPTIRTSDVPVDDLYTFIRTTAVKPGRPKGTTKKVIIERTIKKLGKRAKSARTITKLSSEVPDPPIKALYSEKRKVVWSFQENSKEDSDDDSPHAAPPPPFMCPAA